ncbi:MAG: hypothetical protein NOF05_02005 [Candidatus Accumulibacter phosphatis]|nr:hypothetical protein [Candidatus Accumulibacter phosphatis]
MTCHTFQFHLGLLNSTHFVPQSQNTFIYYHNLALTRAAECKRLSDSFQSSPLYTTAKSLLDEMSTECEREALSLEAIGQHFLQDAWAIGHMWERWGYPTFAQFPAINDSDRRMRALAVGLISGLIHGAESKTHLPDLMSYGHSHDVVWEKPGYPMQPWGIGDLHASELLQDPQYVDQREFFLDCSASSLREVYAATGMISGSLGAAAGTRRNPISECFNQRATNSAIFRGLGLDPLLAALLTLIARHTTASPYGDVVSPALGDEIRTDLVAITVNAALMSILFPSETDLAEGGLTDPGVFVGSEKNSATNSVPPASYADPPLPWPGSSGTGTPDWDPARWIARAFHKAHVKDFCSNSETDSATLKQRVQGASIVDRPIACEICTEFVSRQMRVNGQPSVCEAAGVPANSFTAPNGVSNRTSAAADYCGCGSHSLTLSIRVLNVGTYRYDWVGGYSSEPMGIECLSNDRGDISGSCSAEFTHGSIVKLFSTWRFGEACGVDFSHMRECSYLPPNFTGWSGDCTGNLSFSDELTMDKDRRCTATFTWPIGTP